MGVPKEMAGKVLGRLTVISIVSGETSNGAVLWLCQCECGNQKVIPGYVLRRGASRSCGCLRKEHGAKVFYRHGMSRSRVYRIWNGMVRRCTEVANKDYPRYGGAGITICDEWRNDFAVFYKDMGDPPTDKHEIDRKRNPEGYKPDNCHWVTCTENQRNRTSNRIIIHNGVSKLLIEWSESSCVSYPTFSDRLKRGWSMERALTEPVHNNNRKGKK